MYSKKANITQAVYEALLPVIFTLVSSLDLDINAVYLFALFMLFYCVPFFYTSFKLVRGNEVKIKACILHDLLFVFLPFVVSAVLTDVFVSLVFGAQSWTGMTCFIFMFASSLLTIIFWLKYLLDKKFNNRP